MGCGRSSRSCRRVRLRGAFAFVFCVPYPYPPFPCTTYTPNRHVRVHLYLGWHPGCDETEFVMRHSALVGDFPLDRSGRLALSRVKAKWGLRGCAVSSFSLGPCFSRWTFGANSRSTRVVEPSSIRSIQSIYPHSRSECSQRPKGSSSSLVRPLRRTPFLERAFIHDRLAEPTPSEGTIAMRDLRLRLVTAYDNFLLSLHEATLGRLADTIGLVATVRVEARLVWAPLTHGISFGDGRRSCWRWSRSGCLLRWGGMC